MTWETIIWLTVHKLGTPNDPHWPHATHVLVEKPGETWYTAEKRHRQHSFHGFSFARVWCMDHKHMSVKCTYLFTYSFICFCFIDWFVYLFIGERTNIISIISQPLSDLLVITWHSETLLTIFQPSFPLFLGLFITGSSQCWRVGRTPDRWSRRASVVVTHSWVNYPLGGGGVSESCKCAIFEVHHPRFATTVVPFGRSPTQIVRSITWVSPLVLCWMILPWPTLPYLTMWLINLLRLQLC